MNGAASGHERSIWRRLQLGDWTLRILILLVVLIGVSEVAAAAATWTGLHYWRKGWILLAPLLLVLGLVVSVLWPTRQKWKLLGWLALGVAFGAALMFPMLRIVQDRGVRHDIPALEGAWEQYQAGTLGSESRAELHWITSDDDPIMAVRWGGFIDYEFGSVFVPDGSRTLCEQFPGFCRCRDVEPGFYFCETD